MDAWSARIVWSMLVATRSLGSEIAREPITPGARIATATQTYPMAYSYRSTVASAGLSISRSSERRSLMVCGVSSFGGGRER